MKSHNPGGASAWQYRPQKQKVPEKALYLKTFHTATCKLLKSMNYVLRFVWNYFDSAIQSISASSLDISNSLLFFIFHAYLESVRSMKSRVTYTCEGRAGGIGVSSNQVNKNARWSNMKAINDSIIRIPLGPEVITTVCAHT